MFQSETCPSSERGNYHEMNETEGRLVALEYLLNKPSCGSNVMKAYHRIQPIYLESL